MNNFLICGGEKFFLLDQVKKTEHTLLSQQGWKHTKS